MRPAAKSGYTIIEVLIVLAISTTLLFAAIAVFKGQQGETQYIQSVQDINSKVINYANQVSAGTFPDSQGINCNDNISAPPTISLSSGNLGSRQDCIFLGRAMQVGLNSSEIDFYTVVGNRSTGTGDAVGDITQAYPTATVILGSPIQFLLTDTYNLEYGSTVKAVKAYSASGAPLPGDWYMAGLYVSLNATDSASGNTQLDLYGYDLPNNTPPRTTAVSDCIRTNNPCTSVQPISKWNVCIQNADKNKQFGLNIRSTTEGLTTELTDGTC